MSSHPAQQISGVYHRKIGDIVVTALSDGYVDANLDLLKNVDAGQARAILLAAIKQAAQSSIQGGK